MYIIVQKYRTGKNNMKAEDRSMIQMQATSRSPRANTFYVVLLEHFLPVIDQFITSLAPRLPRNRSNGLGPGPDLTNEIFLRIA